jgi:hypothetical protein
MSGFPAKAGTQIQPERLVGFTWAPAFAGETVFLAPLRLDELKS